MGQQQVIKSIRTNQVCARCCQENPASALNLRHMFLSAT